MKNLSSSRHLLTLSIFLVACSDESDGEGSGTGATSSGGAESSASGGGSPTDGGGSGGGPSGAGGGLSSAGGGASGAGGGASQGERNACKRGVAYGHHSKADFAELSPAISWWYNWHYLPDTALRDGSYADAGVEYVPMVWGGTFDGTRMISEIPEGVRYLLGFNEPNFGEQANLSAADAAALWPEVEAIADARGLSLVSPAVNFCGGHCLGENPFDYLDDFFAACAGCRVDHVAFHIYVGCNPSGENRAQWLINHVETYKERFSQPLWLTEFACDDATSWDDQVAFLRDAVEYLENDPRIERYAWFSGRFDDPSLAYVDLLGTDGELTPLGQAYVDAPAHPDCPD